MIREHFSTYSFTYIKSPNFNVRRNEQKCYKIDTPRMTHLSVPDVGYKSKNYFLNNQKFWGKKKRRNLLRL